MRDTWHMATEPSRHGRVGHVSLTVHEAEGDLLDIDPLDLGPDAPATAALAAERGPQPADVPGRGA